MDHSVESTTLIWLFHELCYENYVSCWRYVKAARNKKASAMKPDGRKVIAMSLYGKNPYYTWGVLRNAQLVPVYLPDWTLRVYVAADPTPPELAVSPRILNKLRHLGAEIATVSIRSSTGMAPRNWRLLVVDDQNLHYFLLRDADTRLSEREAATVGDWVSTAEKHGSLSAVVHCIRDHPKHAERAIVDGLWGGCPRAPYRLLRQDFAQLPYFQASSNKTFNVMSWLNRVLWPAVSNFSCCHDSVSPCGRWTPLTSQRAFPVPRRGREYIGQKFDRRHQLIHRDHNQLKTDVFCNKTFRILDASTSASSKLVTWIVYFWLHLLADGRNVHWISTL